jgi:hypothetical protein
MRRITVAALLVFVLVASVVSLTEAQGTGVILQEETAEVTPEVTTAPTSDTPPAAATAYVRIAHFVPDGPTLNVLVDGSAGVIQTVSYPMVTGWASITTEDSVRLTLAPSDANTAEDVIGDVFLPAGSWTNIVIVGSVANGTVHAYAFGEDFRPVPEGCARVTIFHALEDAPAVDLIADNGATFVNGLAFPGRENSVSTPLTCAQVDEFNTVGVDLDTSDVDAADSDTPLTDTNALGAMQCLEITGTVSQRANASANSLARLNAGRSAVAGCAYSFDVPGVTYNLSLVQNGSPGSVLVDLHNAQFAAGTYYMMFIVGTPDSPQLLVFTSGSGAPTSLQSTPETTAEATAEPTIEMTAMPTP